MNLDHWVEYPPWEGQGLGREQNWPVAQERQQDRPKWPSRPEGDHHGRLSGFPVHLGQGREHP
jgi:hypothetical protein